MSNRTVTGNTLQDVYHCWLRHKRKSVLLFVGVVMGVAVIALLTPKQYSSHGKLFVRLGRENATLDPTTTLGPNPIVAVPQSRESEINSVVEILQSRVLLEKVVDGLGPAAILGSGRQGGSADEAVADDGGWIQQAGTQIGQVFAGAKNLLAQIGAGAGLDDREKAILQLGKKVKAEAAKKSNVIEISCEAATPAGCQSVVAKLIDAYLDEHLRLNRTHGSQQFFAEQTRRLREALSAKESELRDLKNRTGLASPSAQRQIMVTRIGRLEDDLLGVESAQAVAEAKVRQLRQKLESLPDTQLAHETAGFGNEGTDKMREQFYALQVREKEAAARYTDEHPKLRQIREQVSASREVLEREDRNRTQVTKEPGRLHHQAQSALLSEEPALASLRAQAGRVRTQLAEVREQLAALNENEMRIAALQREVDLLEADYRKYSVTLEQARIDQQLEAQRMSNIGIVQPASYEPRPVRPRMLLNLMLGLCAGACGGLALPLALEWRSGSPPPADEAGRHSQSPTLATVPQVAARHFDGQRRRVPR